MTAQQPDIDIRLMQAVDLPAVLTLQAQAYRTLPPESLPCYQAKLAAAPTSCFVAMHHSQLIGYLVSHPWISTRPPAFDAPDCVPPAAADCLYLHDLAVHPDSRKLGAGAALVRRFFAVCAATQQTLACLVAVEGAHSYWQRHGFTTITPSAELARKLVGYGDAARFMHKRL